MVVSLNAEPEHSTGLPAGLMSLRRTLPIRVNIALISIKQISPRFAFLEPRFFSMMQSLPCSKIWQLILLKSHSLNFPISNIFCKPISVLMNSSFYILKYVGCLLAKYFPNISPRSDEETFISSLGIIL